MGDTTIDYPDTEHVGISDLYCFVNRERPCSADCVAFRTFPEASKHLDMPQAHCTLLVYAERGSRSLNILASIAGQFMSKAKNKAADEARSFQTVPGASTTEKR